MRAARGRDHHVRNTFHAVQPFVADVARIDGVLHNFMHHVTGGLSGFIMGAYDSCDRANKPVLLFKLVPDVQLEDGFGGDADLAARTQALRQKLLEILRAESDTLASQVTDLMVEVDFSWDPAGAETRRRELGGYYPLDPVYRCTISLKLASGEERTRVQRH